MHIARLALILAVFLAPNARADEKPVWLVHVPGMGGEMPIDHLVTRGMVDGGLDAEVMIFDWTGNDRGPVALAQMKRHATQSSLLADLIVRHVREHPNQRVIVTAHSAGTGIVAWALEKLPEDVMVDDIVFIAAALSPEFDLSLALRHVRNKVYAFNSELDYIVLSVGTKMFGTIDRLQVAAAGMVGFKAPGTADAAQYEKLVQFPYDEDWVRFGNGGEHIGAMMRPFAKNVIARVLLGKGLPPRATTRPSTLPSTQPTTKRQ